MNDVTIFSRADNRIKCGGSAKLPNTCLTRAISLADARSPCRKSGRHLDCVQERPLHDESPLKIANR
jgi:hypothetical protein